MEPLTHNLKSFISVSAKSHFPIQNVPFGVFYPKSDLNKIPRCGTIVGNNYLMKIHY